MLVRMYHTVARTIADRKIVHSQMRSLLDSLCLSLTNAFLLVRDFSLNWDLVDFLFISLISLGGNCIESENRMKRGAAKLRWAGEGAQRFVLRVNEPKRTVRAAHARILLQKFKPRLSRVTLMQY